MQTEIITHETLAPSDAPDTLRLSPHAALVMVEEGSPVLLDMGGDFYGISDIGAQMLKISLARGQRAAAEEIAAQYKTETERVAADLDALLRDLETRGVILRGTSPPRGKARSAAAGMIARCLSGVFRLTRRPRRRAAMALYLSRMSFALFGWNATVDAWRARFPAPATPADAAAGAFDPTIDTSVRDMAAQIWLGVDCKERALSSFAMARHAGQPAELNIGIALYPLGGHCWCTSGETVIGDDPERSGPLIPVFQFS